MAQQATVREHAGVGSHGVSPVSLGRELIAEVMEDDVLGLAAEMSYRFLLALFPFFIFLAALSGFAANWVDVANPTDEVMSLLEDTLPQDAASVLRTQVRGVIESQNGGLLSFGIVAALWAASSGVKAVMKGTNRAYDVTETRPFWRKYVVAIALTLLGTLAMIGGFVALVFGQFYAGALARELGLGEAYRIALAVAQWPLVVIVLLLVVSFLYRVAPNVTLPWRWVAPGALLFVVVWLLATAGFAFYVANFGSYNETYGAIGGVIILLLWFYLTSAILLIGAELNAVLYRRLAPAGDDAADDRGPREASRPRG